MAKSDNSSQASTSEQPAAAAGDRRRIILPNGEARADFIRRRWKEGASRSEITKELNTPENNPALAANPENSKLKIPYQIVFQATKGQEGGPAPKTEASASAETAEVSA